MKTTKQTNQFQLSVKIVDQLKLKFFVYLIIEIKEFILHSHICDFQVMTDLNSIKSNKK